MERVRKILSILHELVRLSDVCKAPPEHDPFPISKAPFTMLEVPGETDRQTEREDILTTNGKL